MAQKLSRWQSPRKKPKLIGVYRTATLAELQRKVPIHTYYNYWNGKFWGASSLTISSAKRVKNFPTAFNQTKLYWRGIIE